MVIVSSILSAALLAFTSTPSLEVPAFPLQAESALKSASTTNKFSVDVFSRAALTPEDHARIQGVLREIKQICEEYTGDQETACVRRLLEAAVDDPVALGEGITVVLHVQ